MKHLLWNSVKSNSISHCPVLPSSVAARNLCTSVVELTFSRDQAVVYVRYTSTAIAFPLYFFFCFFPITIYVVFYYYIRNKDVQNNKNKKRTDLFPAIEATSAEQRVWNADLPLKVEQFRHLDDRQASGHSIGVETSCTVETERRRRKAIAPVGDCWFSETDAVRRHWNNMTVRENEITGTAESQGERTGLQWGPRRRDTFQTRAAATGKAPTTPPELREIQSNRPRDHTSAERDFDGYSDKLQPVGLHTKLWRTGGRTGCQRPRPGGRGKRSVRRRRSLRSEVNRHSVYAVHRKWRHRLTTTPATDWISEC